MAKIFLLFLLVFINLKAGDNIRLMTEIFPPFQYKHEDKLIGISTNIVNAIQKEMSVNNEIEVHLWSKALSIVNKDKNTAIFSMLRTPEREDQYKWVGPISSMKLVFFKKKGSDITLNSIEDAKKVKKIGVAQGVANFEMLSSQGFNNLEVLKKGEDEHNIRKLVNGEIDLWPTLYMAGVYNALRQGLAGEIVAIENVVAFSGDLYIAFNKETDDKIILKWQTTLNKLKDEQIVDKIIQRYKQKDVVDYELFLKVLVGVSFIIGIFIYHNRKLAKMNKELKSLRDELLRQANRDPLTGLYNRRYFNNIASTLMDINKREKKDISIIVIDIDDFKLINDTYGHARGDEAIKHLSSLLKQSTRSSDIIARFGGEEFVILLVNSSLEMSFNTALKIREVIESNNIVIDDKNSLKFTISVGVDRVLETDESIEASLDRADKALYQSKKSGKNKVSYFKDNC